MRFIVRFTLAFVALSVMLVHARAAPMRYAITALRQSAAAFHTYSSGISIDDEGAVVGQAYLTSYPKPLKWTPSNQLIELPLPSGMTYGMALNVAGNGFVAGHAATSATPWQDYPVLYGPSGTVLLRPNGAMQTAIVCDVSSSGTVLINQAGVISLLTASTTTPLNTSGITVGSRTTAAMNDLNEIVVTGSVRVNGIDRVRPYRIRANSPPTLLVSEERDSTVNDINERGIAVGSAVTVPIASAAYFAAVFQNGQITYPQLAGMTRSNLVSINEAASYVGSASTGSVSFPVVGEGNQLHDLRTLIPANSGWELQHVDDINNRGQIIGLGRFDHDGNPGTSAVYSGFRLDPIRSPGDTNYDDVIDFTDLLTLAQHYGESGNGNVFYETGDFDYNWVVDFDDLLTLAQHYSTPGLFESDWVLARSLVPEPVSFLGLAALVGFARSRRA